VTIGSGATSFDPNSIGRMIDRTKAVWELSPAQALAALETTPDGLSRAEVRARRARIGPNRIGGRRRTAALRCWLASSPAPSS
jgi:hypothetical protein